MHFIFVFLFLILCIHSKSIESNSKSDLIKTLCGSWIIAENNYHNSIYLFDTITKYHQINITRDDASDSLLVVKVHVVTGEVINGLFSIVIDDMVDTSSSFHTIHIESLVDHSIHSFKLHIFENGIHFGVYQSEQFSYSLILTDMNQIQIVRQPHTKGLLTRYTGKKIQEKQVKTQFERFGGIGVSILAILLLVLQQFCLSRR